MPTGPRAGRSRPQSQHRGQDEARRLGSWLKKSGHMPDHALVSDAKRTYQSFAALELTCAVDLMAQLYLAEPASLRAAIHAQCHHALPIAAGA